MTVILRFGLVGLLNTLVGFAVITGLLAAGLGDYPAHLCGYVAGLALSFVRSEEHTSELQSLMRISYAVFCLKKHMKWVTPRRSSTCGDRPDRMTTHLTVIGACHSQPVTT